MLSSFTGSSIDNVLLQTNPGCTSRFLTLHTLLHDRRKPCNKLAVGAHRWNLGGIYWRFLNSF